MRKLVTCTLWMFAVLAALAFVGQPAYGQDAEENESKPAEAASGENGAEAEEPDPYEVPEGTAEELLEYIAEVRKQPMRARSFEEFQAIQIKLQGAVLTAAERALAAEPTDEQMEAAYAAKLAALMVRLKYGRTDEIVAKMKALPDTLKEAGLDVLARRAQRTLVGDELGELRTVDADRADELLDTLAAFLDDHVSDILDPFVGCETAAAVQAFAPSTGRTPLSRLP